jgi:hypothetical protein
MDNFARMKQFEKKSEKKVDIYNIVGLKSQSVWDRCGPFLRRTANVLTSPPRALYSKRKINGRPPVPCNIQYFL